MWRPRLIRSIDGDRSGGKGVQDPAVPQQALAAHRVASAGDHQGRFVAACDLPEQRADPRCAKGPARICDRELGPLGNRQIAASHGGSSPDPGSQATAWPIPASSPAY